MNNLTKIILNNYNNLTKKNIKLIKKNNSIIRYNSQILTINHF